MKCLLCDKDKANSDIFDIFSEDCLCHNCRSLWEKKEIVFRYEGVKLRSTYIYNEAFSKALIQYKECYDEALKDIFLYGLRYKLNTIYHGYTMLLMPSSLEKEERRGFSHLELIFNSLELPYISPFIKDKDISQKSQNINLRKEIRNSIKLKEGIEIPKKVLLVDDVITSGATLSSAIACLNKRSKDMQIYTISYSKEWLFT